MDPGDAQLELNSGMSFTWHEMALKNVGGGRRMSGDVPSPWRSV
jgi:hypothetical protein